MLAPKLLLTPIKIWIFGQKTAKFCPKYAFWPNIGICGQFGPMANQKNDANKVPRWFFCYVDTKTFASSQKNKDFWPKNSHIWPEIGIIGHFGPNICIFGPFRPMPDQKNNANKMRRWFFRNVGTKTNFCFFQ